MAKDANAYLMNESSITDTTTGSWFDLHTRAPFEGLPVEIRIEGGAATSSTKTLTLTIQGGTDGSSSSETLYTKAYSITTTAANNYFHEIIDNFRCQYRYVRAVATFSAAITTGTSCKLAFVTGSQL